MAFLLCTECGRKHSALEACPDRNPPAGEGVDRAAFAGGGGTKKPGLGRAMIIALSLVMAVIAAASGFGLWGHWAFAETIREIADSREAGQDAVGETEPQMREEPPRARSGGELVLPLSSSVEMKFVQIPAGTFRMGSPSSEEEREDDEIRHEVTLSKPFYMGIHEVTQAQYEAVMGTNPSYFKGAKLPVDWVSWFDATEFCRKLSEKTGRTVRLPTEAEWEYACRAGTTTPFSFGETISTEQANYDGDAAYGNGNKGENREKTTPVGIFPANAWGLYDMHGNVAEWCSDWYGDYPDGAATDPEGPSVGDDRVVRGGSWFIPPESCRSACRGCFQPGISGEDFGFRVVLDE